MALLKGRKHRAKVGNSISSELEVKSGVPQGSVLGPLFFIIFINDIPQGIMSSCFGYADDYKVLATCNIRPNTTQRRSVEKVPINDWQASVTLNLLVFHRLDFAS